MSKLQIMKIRKPWQKYVPSRATYTGCFLIYNKYIKIKNTDKNFLFLHNNEVTFSLTDKKKCK